MCHFAPLTFGVAPITSGALDCTHSPREKFRRRSRNSIPASASSPRKEFNLSITNAITTPAPAISDRLVTGTSRDESTIASAPRQILQSALQALYQGPLSDVVNSFDDCFSFNDHALGLEFSEKPRMTAFFEKSRALFPDAAVEVVSLFEDRNHAIAEWKLTATETMSYGSYAYRFRISAAGTTVVRVECGRIVQWSDYYDKSSSYRMNLAAFFTEWIEY
jgi:hypothetical protein